MDLRQASDSKSGSIVRRFVTLIAAVLAVVTFAALGFTLVTLLQAGPSGVAEFGLDALRFAWPTGIALAVLVFGPAVSARFRTPPYIGLSFLIVWIGSAAAYSLGDASLWSVRNVMSTLIWTATPLVPVFTVRVLLLLRSGLHPSAQTLIAAASGVVFWWLTAPIAIVVSCAMTGSCP